VQELWRRVSGKKDGDETKGWEKAVGWVWTVSFLLFWSSPAWFWPQVCKKEFLEGKEGKLIPFSVFADLF
jgi:hypothetical protein